MNSRARSLNETETCAREGKTWDCCVLGAVRFQPELGETRMQSEKSGGNVSLKSPPLSVSVISPPCEVICSQSLRSSPPTLRDCYWADFIFTFLSASPPSAVAVICQPESCRDAAATWTPPDLPPPPPPPPTTTGAGVGRNSWIKLCAPKAIY